MRLTLRTLLSWKDGMLPADVAGEIAAKIEASAAARRLVERIDEVAARPTLSAASPDAGGFAGSANSTAEYLDNVMSSERIGEFEQVCYASDAQLAEAASTHELLAALSREPAAALDVTARRRLLAAVRARATGSRDAVAAAPEPLPGVSISTAPPIPPAAPTRAAPASAWLLVVAALTLLATLVGVLGWSLWKPARRGVAPRELAARQEAPPQPPPGAAPPVRVAPEADAAVTDPDVPGPASEADVPDASAGAAPPVQAPTQPPIEPPAATAAAASDLPPFGTEQAAPPEGAAPLQTEVVVPAPPPTVTAGDRVVPQGDALAIAAPAVPAVAAARPDTAPPPPRAAAERAAADCRVADGDVVLHRPAGTDADAWLTGAANSPLGLPVDLVAPPFSGAALVVDDVRIKLEPGTRAAVSRDPDGTPRLEVVFGVATVAGSGRVGVTAGGLVGAMAAVPAAPVRVAVALVRRPGVASESAERVARVVPAEGGIVWRPMAADGAAVAEQPIAAAQEVVWRSGVPDEVSIRPASPFPDGPAGRRDGDGIDTHASRALRSRLVAGVPAKPALRNLAAGRSEQRLAAAAALALLGDFGELARLLTAEDPAALPNAQWERLDLVAVQPALARGPKAADALARAIAEHGPPGAADTIVRFARGIGDDELAAGGAADLVAALESPHLVVRRYALANLVEITGVGAADRLQYRADWRDENLRAKGAAWWRTWLEQGRIRRGGER